MRPFGIVDDIVIKQYYPIMTDDELSTILNRSRDGVRHRARTLGLKPQNGKPYAIRKTRELKRRRNDVIEVLKRTYPRKTGD